jgi:hypothetical protein
MDEIGHAKLSIAWAEREGDGTLRRQAAPAASNYLYPDPGSKQFGSPADGTNSS